MVYAIIEALGSLCSVDIVIDRENVRTWRVVASRNSEKCEGWDICHCFQAGGGF